MTPLQQDPSAQAPWTRTMFGRPFIVALPSSELWKRRVSPSRRAGAHRTILRFESCVGCAWDMLAARSGCRRAPRGSSMGATRNSR